MKTILITSFHVLVSRNIFTAPFLSLLVKDGYRVIAVVPEKKKEFFERQFGRQGVIVCGLKNRLTRLDAFFKTLALAALRTRSLTVMKKRGMGIEHPFLFRMLSPVAPFCRRFIPLLYRLFMPRGAFADLFKEYRPDLVFSTDVFSANDCRIMLEAKRLAIPVLGMVRSWDNLTTKGGFRVVPDILAVNNTLVQEEAIGLHDISPDIIRIVGIPHYDRYLAPPSISRQQFLQSLDMARDARFILYAPLGDRIVKVGDRIVPHTFDKEAVALIVRSLPRNYFLLVRMPPTDTVTLGNIESDPRVRIDRPGQKFGAGDRAVRITELSRTDDDRLVASIGYSDAVITVFSSICVDAAVLKKPVVIFGFDPSPVSYWQSIARIHEFEHIRPVIKNKAIIEARSEPELQSILSQLPNLPANEEARTLFVEDECYRTDGHSSERLLSALKEALSHVKID